MKKNQAMVITVLSTAIFTLAALLSARLWFRLDLTRDKTYTISELSRNLYREISDTVKITYFVSGKLALAHPLPNEIADLLREYAAHSRGKIRFIQKDPAKEEIRRVVEDLGIVPWQIEVAEKNETTLATVYSGVLIEYLEREAVIPLVYSPDTLEYDLSSRIRALVRNIERDIGVIVGDAHKEWHSEFALLNQELFLSGFRVRLLNPGDEIPHGLPALFVLGGAEGLDEYCLLPIDRYIQEGGSVFFALDGVFVDSLGSFEARPAEDMGLLAMLANYGVIVRRALALDRTALALTYQNQSGIQTAGYPEWIGVRPEGANPDHPLSARFGGLDLYWASPLELAPPPGVRGEILFTSTAEAWLQTERFITNPDRVSEFEDEKGRTIGTKILGVCLSGNFPSAFGGLQNPQALLGKPSRIIVVGDADFAGSLMQATRAEARNLEFLIRAAEWLSGDDELLAIRPADRGQGAGRLDRITDRDRRNAVMAFSRTINTVVIPLLVVIAGFFVCGRRGKNKRIS